MKLFTHGPGNEHPDIMEIEETALVPTLLVEGDGEGHAWLEEVDGELDLDITLQAAGVHHHQHVHHGPCHRVDVVVRWNGNHEHVYAPSATIGKVERWAFGPKVGNFSPEQAAQHVLAAPGADHFLDVAVHVGSLLTTGACMVTLDLLPRSRFEG